MFYDLGLLATVAIGGWLALDPLTATGWRRSNLAVGVLAAAGGLWAAGDLLIVRAGNAEELLFARRVTYLGICLLPVAWLMVAAEAARPAWWRRPRRALVVTLVPSFFFYSCLFWDDGTWFIDASRHPVGRGPLFWGHATYAWALIVVGWVYCARAAMRLQKANPARMLVLAAGTGIPLLGNVLYVALGLDGPDPTPVLLGVGGVLIRTAVIDSGLVRYLPLARSDVIEQLEVGILVADLEGCVIDANGAARQLVQSPEPVGADLDALLAAARARSDTIVEVRTFPLRSPVAEVGRAALLADRTEAVNTERRLQLAARLEALGFLTAGIAHEVNNPLAFIRANLSQLEKLTAEISDPAVQHCLPERLRHLVDEGRDVVTETRDGVERISDLVVRLKAFARQEPEAFAEPRLVALSEVAATAAAMAGVGLGASAIHQTFTPAPRVRAIEGDLVQIALNLLLNAIQACGDTIEVGVEVEARDGGALLRVSDLGPGIDPDALPHVFDPFFTTKPPGHGTGLGLSLSYDLARRNGGRLDATNRPEGGAEFTLWLPAAALS